MTTHSLQSTIKKYATRMMHSVISAVQNIYKKIMIMDRYEQVFVISLLVVTLLFMVSPLMILSPNETDSSRQYIFLLWNLQFIKTALVIFFWLFLTLAWHLNITVKNYIIEYIWFNRNPYLFSFFLLFAVLSVLMSLGEMNSIVSDYTTMLHMHLMYYIIRILLTCIVWFCVYMLLYSSHGEFKWTVVWYHSKQPSHASQDDEMQWLFDNLKDS